MAKKLKKLLRRFKSKPKKTNLRELPDYCYDGQGYLMPREIVYYNHRVFINKHPELACGPKHEKLLELLPNIETIDLPEPIVVDHPVIMGSQEAREISEQNALSPRPY